MRSGDFLVLRGLKESETEAETERTSDVAPSHSRPRMLQGVCVWWGQGSAALRNVPLRQGGSKGPFRQNTDDSAMGTDDQRVSHRTSAHTQACMRAQTARWCGRPYQNEAEF